MYRQLLPLLALLVSTDCKIYERCELARELLEVHEAKEHHVATWVCIAYHESRYNTSAVGMLNGDESWDHGLFQISDLYWCSPPGKGKSCGLTCSQLEDEDIEDDFICANRIYREHKRLSGDGFNAWAVYRPHCQGSHVKEYIQDCFTVTIPNATVTQRAQPLVERHQATTITSKLSVTSRFKNNHILKPTVFPPISNFATTSKDSVPQTQHVSAIRSKARSGSSPGRMNLLFPAFKFKVNGVNW